MIPAREAMQLKTADGRNPRSRRLQNAGVTPSREELRLPSVVLASAGCDVTLLVVALAGDS